MNMNAMLFVHGPEKWYTSYLFSRREKMRRDFIINWLSQTNMLDNKAKKLEWHSIERIPPPKSKILKFNPGSWLGISDTKDR